MNKANLQTSCKTCCISGPVTSDMVDEMKKPRCGNSDRVYTSSPDTCTFLASTAEVESEVEPDRRWKKLVLPTGKVLNIVFNYSEP